MFEFEKRGIAYIFRNNENYSGKQRNLTYRLKY